LTQAIQQYLRLLSLEYAGCQQDKASASMWLTYVLLVMDKLQSKCNLENLNFLSYSSEHQAKVLREVANELRQQCCLPISQLVWDEADARKIVDHFSVDNGDVEAIYRNLQKKHSKMLNTAPVSRSTS
jgi:hypothetical protein